MKPFLFALLALLLTPILGAAAPFAQEGSDLRADTTARFGTLPNGLRYVIMPNHEPKDRAAIRLVVLAGSIHERDDQRGLAHFLEHMAFNGSKDYAPGTLVEVFQRMGMSFGADSNASTGFDRTIYMLNLPDTKETTMAEGLKVFANYAGSLLLLDPEIDKERGVILSEKRTRDSVGYRTYVAQFGYLLGSTIFSKRQVIGEESVLTQAKRGPFLDFYDTWYRPERMAAVVVGDIDPAVVEKQIAAALSGLAARGPGRPVPNYGQIARPEGVLAQFHREAEAPSTSISLESLTPYSYEPDNKAKRLKYLPRDIAVSMFNRRLSIIAKKEGATFTSGRLSIGEAYDFWRDVSIDLDTKPGQWSAALGTAEQELRRALEFGFQPSELAEVVADFRNDLEQAAKAASTRRSEDLAMEIAGSIVDREVFTTPADDLALYGPALARVTPAECLEALRTAWSAPHRYVLVAGNATIPGDPVATITSAYNSSRNVAVTAPEKISDVAWGYTDFGTPGTVASRSTVTDLDVTLVTFSNGVRLNIKKTDFEANTIDLLARIGTGQLTEPKNQPGLASFSSRTFGAGGLGRHSTDDLRRVLAGKTVGVGFSVSSDALTFGGGANKEDLLLELQLLAAHITDPGYREEAQRQAQKQLEQAYLSYEHTPTGPFVLEVSRSLANGDPRFGLPSRDVMMGYTMNDVKAWVGPQLAKGAIELSIVGDLDIEATIQAVSRTLGALPPRDPRPAMADLRKVSVPEKTFEKEFAVDTEIPNGIVALYWPTTDSNDVQRTRRLNVLASILTDRLRIKVREELGDAYSPSAGHSPSDTYTGYGLMQARVTIDPPKAKLVGDVVLALGAELIRTGTNDDELRRIKEPILTGLRESSRSNSYWLGTVLAKAQEKPEVLDWCRSRYADYTSITKEDVDALAKTYLAPEKAFRITVVPMKK